MPAHVQNAHGSRADAGKNDHFILAAAFKERLRELRSTQYYGELDF